MLRTLLLVYAEGFVADSGGQLRDVLDEVLSLAGSIDMTAPALVLLEGASGSGRSALLAQVPLLAYADVC
jgi:ABC-type lipoprotein export system ATPase subunit